MNDIPYHFFMNRITILLQNVWMGDGEKRIQRNIKVLRWENFLLLNIMRLIIILTEMKQKQSNEFYLKLSFYKSCYHISSSIIGIFFGVLCSHGFLCSKFIVKKSFL